MTPLPGATPTKPGSAVSSFELHFVTRENVSFSIFILLKFNYVTFCKFLSMNRNEFYVSYPMF